MGRPCPAGTVVLVISRSRRRGQGHAGGGAAPAGPRALAQPLVDHPVAPAGGVARRLPLRHPRRLRGRTSATAGSWSGSSSSTTCRAARFPTPPGGQRRPVRDRRARRGHGSRSCTRRPCWSSSTHPTARSRRRACAAGATTRSGSRQRLAKADEEVAHGPRAPDVVHVVNDDLDRAASELQELLRHAGPTPALADQFRWSAPDPDAAEPGRLVHVGRSEVGAHPDGAPAVPPLPHLPRSLNGRASRHHDGPPVEDLLDRAGSKFSLVTAGRQACPADQHLLQPAR